MVYTPVPMPAQILKPNETGRPAAMVPPPIPPVPKPESMLAGMSPAVTSDMIALVGPDGMTYHFNRLTATADANRLWGRGNWTMPGARRNRLPGMSGVGQTAPGTPAPPPIQPKPLEPDYNNFSMTADPRMSPPPMPFDSGVKPLGEGMPSLKSLTNSFNPGVKMGPQAIKEFKFPKSGGFSGF